MLRSKGLFAVLAVSLFVSAAWAQDAPAKPKKPKDEAKNKSALRGEYAIMAAELKLSDEKKAELAQAVAQLNAARAESAKANAPKLEELSKALKAAREAKDKEKTKELSGQLAQIKAEQAKASDAAQAKVRQVLTPEQQAQWECFTVYRAVLSRYRKAELTDEQKQKIRALSGEAAKQLSATTDAKAQAGLKADLNKQVAALLTPEQTEKMKAPAPKPAPKGEKKAEEKK